MPQISRHLSKRFLVFDREPDSAARKESRANASTLLGGVKKDIEVDTGEDMRRSDFDDVTA